MDQNSQDKYVKYPLKQYTISGILHSCQNHDYIMKPPHNLQQKESVNYLRKVLQTNHKLRCILQAGLSQIPTIVVEKYQEDGVIKKCEPRPGLLHGKSVDQVLDTLNFICQTPPKFENKQLAAIPFASALYDLVQTQNGQIFFSDPQVNQCLKRIFDDYAAMLKTPKSLKYVNQKENGWFCPQARQRVNYEDFVCNQALPHYGFSSWNDWFTRSLKENRRPVDPHPDTIVNNCESYPLTSIQTPTFNVRQKDMFWLKHAPHSLIDMFAVEQQAGMLEVVRESFVNGTVYQSCLTPWCYHRWHAPVSGIIQHSYAVKGSYFIFNPSLPKDFKDCYDQSLSIMAMVSNRHIFIIKADNPKIGRVGVIQVGLTEVSGCHSAVKVGDHVQKGQMIGRFEFGGSASTLVFDRKAKLQFSQTISDRAIDPKTNKKVPLLQKVNSTLAKIV